jgi:hypothetical protein
VVGLVCTSALAVGCGGEKELGVADIPEPDHVREVARDPYAVTCQDLARQPLNTPSQLLVIHAEFALARAPALKKVVAVETRNRTGRSVYYAMTEICKRHDASFKPGRPAVKAVSEGKYLAARHRPG